MAPIHELYPPIASYYMSPLELWELLQVDASRKVTLIEDVIESRARRTRDEKRYKKFGAQHEGRKKSPSDKDEL